MEVKCTSKTRFKLQYPKFITALATQSSQYNMLIKKSLAASAKQTDNHQTKFGDWKATVKKQISLRKYLKCTNLKM